MQEPGSIQRKLVIPFLEGVNSLVSYNIGQKTEFIHGENARSKVIGTIEKRGGQTVLGTNINNQPFVTTGNYGLFSFQNSNNPGFYRISIAENSTLSINTADTMYVSDTAGAGGTSIVNYSIGVSDRLTVSEQVNNNTGTTVAIYYINSINQWVPLTGLGTSIPGGIFDYTYAENNIFLVNFNSNNRYIQSDGVTVTDSSSASGHLWNSPPASKINFYKNRLYIADFIQSGIRYKTTVLRSSYPMGIISLVNDDVTAVVSNLPGTINLSGLPASGSVTITVTGIKFFYIDNGANTYDIYRGQTLITTITVTKINELSLEATWTNPIPVNASSGTRDLLSSDEIWISGTYTGQKVFRWINNPATSGKDVKLYESFKLAGGENDPVTMMVNIGNVMLISNKSTMMSWNDYTLENFDMDIGCVSPKGYVKLTGTLYFIHYLGVFSTKGSVPQLISNKITKYIGGATRAGLENSAAGKKGRHVFFTLGDVTLHKIDGSINKVLKDVCIEYNLTQENWYIHTNVKASEFATFMENVKVDRLEFIDTAGNHSVKEFLSGETDDGTEINFRVDTIKLTMQQSDYEYFSTPTAVVVEVDRGSGMQVFISLENGEDFFPVEGKIVKGLSIVKITNKDYFRGKPPTCRLISISIRDSSKQLCKLSRITLVYIPTTQEIQSNEY